MAWLKSLPCYNATKQPVGTDTVDEKMIQAIEAEVERTRNQEEIRRVKLQVRPNALFRVKMIEIFEIFFNKFS